MEKLTIKTADDCKELNAGDESEMIKVESGMIKALAEPLKRTRKPVQKYGAVGGQIKENTEEKKDENVGLKDIIVMQEDLTEEEIIEQQHYNEFLHILHTAPYNEVKNVKPDVSPLNR